MEILHPDHELLYQYNNNNQYSSFNTQRTHYFIFLQIFMQSYGIVFKYVAHCSSFKIFCHKLNAAYHDRNIDENPKVLLLKHTGFFSQQIYSVPLRRLKVK